MNAPDKAVSIGPFENTSGQAARQPRIWAPMIVTREQIEAEVERLADEPLPSNGRRIARIVHPEATDAMGITPGTDVQIQVLKPGEQTIPRRTNANQLEICIRGGGLVQSEGGFRVGLHSVSTLPPMQSYSHRNDGRDLWVRLTYSNTPLLSYLRALWEEDGEAIGASETEGDGLTERQREVYAWQNAPDLQITEEGARLRGYEYLTDIPVVPNPPLHWPFEIVSEHLTQVAGDGGRTILLLYHPVTERRAGTTPTYFATMARLPANAPPFTGTRGHRHISASINYHLTGSGYSMVDGQRLDWKGGDLLLSAPTWSEHAHYHSHEGTTALTVQDHPMHIALGSLLWQEKMNGPIFALGSQRGQTGYVSPRTTGE